MGGLGAKTRGAFLPFEAGCTMLKNLPPTLDKELQTADRRTSVPSEEKSYPVAVKQSDKNNY
jgi:hypothetical protein